MFLEDIQEAAVSFIFDIPKTFCNFGHESLGEKITFLLVFEFLIFHSVQCDTCNILN